MAYIDVVAVKKAVKDGALITRVNVDGDILLADVKSGEAAKIGELPVGVWAIEGEDIIWGNSLKRRYCTNCCERPHFDKEKRKFILTPFCHNCGAMMKGE